MTSIEFQEVGKFESKLFVGGKSSRRAVRDGVVTASIILFVPQRGVLFVGLSDGKIVCWETDRTAVDRRAKDKPVRVLEEHKSSVRCMIFVESLGQGVMFTGSADRCIKIWDLSDPRGPIPCVRSLYGHGGTILALEFGSNMLLSSSTDGTMCIWRDQSPVKLLRFPAYSIRQKIYPEAKSAVHRAPKESWFLSISLRDGEAPSIFAGDSEGYVHVYRPDTAQEEDRDQIFLLVSRTKVHDFGISRILTVPMESFLFTLSYDQRFKTLDSLSGQVIFEESNQCNVVFNCLAWDAISQEVIVADEKGNIGFYNLYMESCVAWRNLTREPILQLHYEPSTCRLLLLSPHVLRVYDVVRGVKFSELNEHAGPIVAMASRPTPQGGLLYTASMDNTIRMWDTDALECIKCFRHGRTGFNTNEITAMVYLPRANVVITGHENFELKMWSMDSQEEALLRRPGSGHPVHDNTISALITATSAAVGHDNQKISGMEAGGQAGNGFEMVIAGSYDRQLSFWRVTLGGDGTAMAKLERAFVAHEELDEILAIAHSPEGQAVFTGGNSGVIRKWAFWGVRQQLAAYGGNGKGHQDAIVCFAVDGHFLYSGSVDTTVRIWETMSGSELRVVEVHRVAVQALLVVPETNLIASCGFDGRVVLWSPRLSEAAAARSGSEELHTYEQPEEFRSLAYVDLNRTILVGCESGKIIAFPLPAGGSDAAPPPPPPLPELLSGMQTPSTARTGAWDGAMPNTYELLSRLPNVSNLKGEGSLAAAAAASSTRA